MTKVDEVSAFMGERNDCAVRAVAHATGVHYSAVHKMFELRGRKAGRPSKDTWTLEIIKALGFRLEDATTTTKGATVRTRTRSLREGTYLIWVRGHVLCVREGVALDWAAERLHRVKQVHKIIGKPA